MPLVLVSLGISGAWLASQTALEPYRPLFATVALASLGVAAWRLYGPASRCAAEALATAVSQAGFPAKVLPSGR